MLKAGITILCLSYIPIDGNTHLFVYPVLLSKQGLGLFLFQQYDESLGYSILPAFGLPDVLLFSALVLKHQYPCVFNDQEA